MVVRLLEWVVVGRVYEGIMWIAEIFGKVWDVVEGFVDSKGGRVVSVLRILGVGIFIYYLGRKRGLYR